MSKILELHGPQRPTDGKPIWIATGSYEIEPAPAAASMSVIQARIAFMQDEQDHPVPHRPRTIRAAFGTRDATLQFFQGGPQATVNSEPVAENLNVYAVSHLVLSSRDASRTDRLLIQHGEISLDAIRHPPNLEDFLGRMLPGFSGFSEVALNGDGIGLVANVTLPWSDAVLHARFQVRVPFGAEISSQPGIQVFLDRRNPAPKKPDGTPGDVSETLDALRRDFDLLRSALSTFKAAPEWSQLEISDDGIPAFSWDITWSGGRAQSSFAFGRGSVKLTLADGPADGKSTTQRRIVTAQPVVRFREDDGLLFLDITAGKEASGGDPSLSYSWRSDREAIALSKVTAGYNALTLARDVRVAHGIARPGKTPEQRVLWAAMPLIDGWMQWPVYNLVEEHYKDQLPKSADNPLIEGAAVFSNQPHGNAAPIDEHPWSLVVLDASGINGTWTLGTLDGTLQTVSIDFSLREPDLLLEGLLWLAKSPPSLKDALPDLEDFVGTLQSISLSTNQNSFRFACPLEIHCDVVITPRAGTETGPMARLDDLKMSVTHEPRAKLKDSWFEGAGAGAFLAPMLWRHHPNLPFIQSLPLTQTQDPPAHPCASRELAPFDLPWRVPAPPALPEIDPAVWSFASGPDGASNWLVAPARDAAAEWLDTKYPILPLASLSVPGLAILPGAAHELPGESGLGLRIQYEFGLPYLDQLNAFSQLPKDEDEEYRGGLFSGTQNTAPEDKQRRPLGRFDYKGWWEELSTKRFLARTEASDSLVNSNGSIDAPAFAVRGLIEPLDWPIAPPILDHSKYPGLLKLSNDDDSAPLELEGASALRGFDGAFGVEAGDLVRHLAPQAGDFEIIAGSMRAWQADAGGMVLDQRGLSRGSTTHGTLYLDTPVSMDGQEWTIRSWLQAVPLKVGDAAPWQILLIDVALKNGSQFSRKDVVSDQSEDVNDPASQGRNLNPLSGYKWWLGPLNGTTEPLRLFGLDMQPLMLEDVTFDSDRLSITILARLTLPLPLPPAVDPAISRNMEQTQRANAVHLTFSGKVGGPLVLSRAESAVAEGVWTLTTNGDGPLVTWRSVQLQESKALRFGDVRVAFTHFGQSWKVKLGDLLFGGSEAVSAEAAFDQGTPEIKVKNVKLMLDLRTIGASSHQHTIELMLAFHWGDADGLSVETRATYEAWPERGAVALDEVLVVPKSGADGLAFSTDDGAALQPAAALGLQAVFRLKDEADSGGWYLLPGIGLDMTAKEQMHGFIAMSFVATQASAANGGDVVPRLAMTSGAAELLFPCRWGQSLQDAPSLQPIPISAAFGSSCGDLSANCSLLGVTPMGGGAASWERQTLLNGWLEVKNLVSWPSSLGNPAVGGTGSPLPDPIRWTLLFESGQQDPEDPSAAAKIYAEVAELVAQCGGHLRIEGHADEDGSAAENYALSRRRAAEIKKQLQPFLNGINPKPRVEVVPYGEQRLKFVAGDDSAKRQNRRVEIVLTPPGVSIPKLDGSPDGWQHFRHTIRVLFNQHELESRGYGAGKGKIFYSVKDKSSQFLATTEHQIAEVSLDRVDGETVVILHRRWRWCAIQEVRLAAPTYFSKFLASTTADHHGLKPDKEDWSDGVKIGGAFQGLHRAAWIKHLKLGQASDHVAKLGEDALVVEASVALWLKGPDTRSEREPAMTTLQFLPNAVQRAELATPEDIGLVNHDEPPWLTLGLPFIGRMQPLENDILQAPSSILMVDPVLALSRNPQQPNPAVCALACRSENDSSIQVRVSEFDAPEAARWDRLNEGALEEAWFRIQQPPPEPSSSSTFAPLLASAPQDSPGRLSRRIALENAFRAQRAGVPPKVADTPSDPSLRVGDLVWRENNWFGLQMVSDLPSSSPQAFFLPGYLLSSIWAASRSKALEHVLVSATLVPITPRQAELSNNQPVGLAVSPYRCLGSTHFDGVPGSVVLTLAEVLATATGDDGGDARLKPVGQGMWAGDPGDTKIRLWAIELLSQIAPDSPVAVIRLRQTAQQPVDGSAQVAVNYAYLLATPLTPAPVDPPPLPLRSPVIDIHFAEGQYGGTTVPKLLPFENAPPQIAGVQPIYSENLPSEVRPVDRKRLSALRLAVRNLAETSRAVVGAGIDPAAGASTARLWWQALSSHAAYETEGQQRRLLPKGFRAGARGAWLSAPPRLSGPDLKTLPLTPEPPSPDSKAPARILQWQPVMPQGMDVILSGSRAGAPMALRVLTATQTPANGTITPSGSIVVEQRMPRPVSFPPNRQNEVESAHRPWAALWHAEKNCLDQPECLSDVAIFDLSSVRIPADNGNATPYPRRYGLLLRVTEAVPSQLSLLAGSPLPTIRFDGEIYFDKDGIWDWQPLDNQDTNHDIRKLDLSAFFVGEGIRRKIEFVPGSASWGELHLDGDDVLSAWVARQPHGSAVAIELMVPPKIVPFDTPEPVQGFVKGYFQTLRFPLRIRRPDILCAPLQPRVIHFEDPAYNRQLTSTPAQRAGRLFGDDAGDILINVTLASDRREYNPDSELLLVLARKDITGGTFEAQLSLRRQDREGNRTDLVAFDEDTLIQSVADRIVKTLKLSNLRLEKDKDDIGKAKVALQPDDLLYVVVTRTNTGSTAKTVVELPVKIVLKQVLPPPAEAYALLREKNSGTASPVHAPRFAWSPEPSRVELINPDDLLGAAVRRRAVFRWPDSQRYSTALLGRYRIQKIAGSGSTHWPLLE
ncbi:OmpA family protein [Rhizobium leguminosarum]|uniref:OmpA family protein n=1 Tax=Rhizobium leguminosarum TaxID=384 RepID=A0A2Z4Y9J2_RHILE|nr:OmpA family protein [Rhizobium leguminosarum]AXA37947.1 OmpA family protein [Rhizobium leguminosarum]